MNPFEYGKSFQDKSFPKRIGTLTPPKPHILGEGIMSPPPLVPGYAGPIRVNEVLLGYLLKDFLFCGFLANSLYLAHYNCKLEYPVDHERKWMFDAPLCSYQSLASADGAVASSVQQQQWQYFLSLDSVPDIEFTVCTVRCRKVIDKSIKEVA